MKTNQHHCQFCLDGLYSFWSLKTHLYRAATSWTYSRSSLVEGDEQLDRPNSQTTMEFCHSCAAWAETVFISSYQRAPWRNSFVSYGNKLLQDLFSSNHHHHFRALEDDHADNQPDHVRVPCQTTADCCLATSSKLATHFHIYQHLGPKLDFFWGRS